LKGEAKHLRKSTNDELKHLAALDQIAIKYKYSSWNEIDALKSPFRDQIFGDYFENPNIFQFHFEWWQKQNKKDSSLDCKREFIVHFFNKLNRPKPIRRMGKIEDVSQYLLEHLRTNGVSGFLPENLSDELLNQLAFDFENFANKNNEGLDESEQEGFTSLLTVVLVIEAYNRQEFKEICIQGDDLYIKILSYGIELVLEHISRQTTLINDRPTLKNILARKRTVTMDFSALR